MPGITFVSIFISGEAKTRVRRVPPRGQPGCSGLGDGLRGRSPGVYL